MFKMKKKTIYIILVSILLVLCVILILFKTGTIRNSSSAPRSDIFAVKDTADVTKIFIADMNGEHVLLNRRDGTWYVQDSARAMSSKVRDLLSVIRNISLQQTVAKTAQSNINKMMSVNAVKVEIYQIAPKFKIFGIKFFNKERLVKTYYMGPATMDNVANYAILDGFDEPCIVHIPGNRGFLTPYYSFRETEWYNCDLFSTKITRIKTLNVQDYEQPDESFFIEKSGPRFFSLYDAAHNQIMDYDTTKLLDMLSEYRDLNYETFVTSMSESAKDSVLNNNLFKTITLTDVDGNETKLDMYRKLTPDAFYLDAIVGREGDYSDDPYNRDKFYAVLNGNTANLVQCQYYHFQRQVQPLTYFLKERK